MNISQFINTEMKLDKSITSSDIYSKLIKLGYIPNKGTIKQLVSRYRSKNKHRQIVTITANEHYSELQRIAYQHFNLTGEHLKDPTGVLGEYFAAKILGLELAIHNQEGYDAVDEINNKYQIKTTKKVYQCTYNGIKMYANWDYILFVVLSIKYKPICIWSITKELMFKNIDKLNQGGANLSIVKKLGNIVYKNKSLFIEYFPNSS